MLGEPNVDACVDELSTEPRELLFGRRFNVLLLLPQLSSLRRRLWRLVNVPPRSGDAGFDESSMLLRSFNCRVIDVSGIFGFIDGFLFIVPVGKSESNALLSSDKQPLELELEALDNRPFDEVIVLLLLFTILLLSLLHCDGTDETMLPIELLRFDENLSISSLAKSSTNLR